MTNHMLQGGANSDHQKGPNQVDETIDVRRIKCDISHVCGEQARWGTHKGPAFSYVCEYHRRVYEATGTFWNDAGYRTLAPTTQTGG
jgi:hypothetical protein